MSCEDVSDLLFEPEDELSDGQKEQLEEHLAACETCLEERELFIDSWSALDELEPELEPCPLIRAKVWEQIRVEEAQTPALFDQDLAESAKSKFKKLAVACLALLLGFGLGRGLRPTEAPAAAMPDEAIASQASETQDFLDPDLLELASQEGYSVEIFPESSDFSPLDQEMMSALAPNEDAKRWLNRDTGAVVPVRFISQESQSP